jgi:pimeloyl-ACP methyl ester carboxylesterase
MTAPEAVPGMLAIDPPDSTWVNRVAARVMLTVGSYRPYSKFAKLRMPVLVQTCDEDATTPPGPAVKAAERSPNAELIRYPIGHFEIYVENFERTIADQLEFLTRNLLATPAALPSRPAGPPVPAR